MNRFQPRPVRRAVGSTLVGFALLVVSAVPTVAATTLPSVTPVCNLKAATIVAQPGATSVRGTQGPDVIVALERGVRIDGRGGDDTICAGDGDNIINGGAGNDWINGGDGTNTTDGGSGNDTMYGGTGNDTILGDIGNDVIHAGDGDNLVSTGSGDDTIVTGAGDDRVDGGKDYDTCDAGGGSNYVGHCEGSTATS
jgi:hypothetical protein